VGLSEQALGEIENRNERMLFAHVPRAYGGDIGATISDDVPALLAEVRRLREEDVHRAVRVGALRDEVERLQAEVESLEHAADLARNDV
jgi:uncharacterized small protein (DUF1192 family)